MQPLSVFIITLNEEINIERCIESFLPVADEIIVVDSFSTDRTYEICKKYDVLFVTNKFEGYIEQKNFALSLLKHELVLCVDADEALSEELRLSLEEVKNNPVHDGYTMNRLTNFCGHWIHHCGWYPDRKLRLFKKTKATFGGTNPHDKVIMQPHASVLHLKGDLLHYSYYNIFEHVEQANKFTNITAQAAFDRGKKSNTGHVLLAPFFKFIKSYFLQLGFLDGYYGFVVCGISAHATFYKYVKLKFLWEENSKKLQMIQKK